MKAIVFESFGGPEVLKVKEMKKPEPSNNDVSKNLLLVILFLLFTMSLVHCICLIDTL